MTELQRFDSIKFILSYNELPNTHTNTHTKRENISDKINGVYTVTFSINNLERIILQTISFQKLKKKYYNDNFISLDFLSLFRALHSYLKRKCSCIASALF